MNKKIRICIADDNEELTTCMVNYLKTDDRIEIVKVCNNGKDVLETVDENEIDVLILDLILPYVDGLGVIEKLAENKKEKMPKVIIVSAIAHDKWKFKLLELGISYYMLKPLDMDILIKRIVEVYEEDKQKQNLEQRISEKLRELAIYPNLIGYKYIKKSIELLVEHPIYAKNFRENIYSILAKENGVKEFKIEKAINNAIHTSWNKDKEKIISIFKSNIYRSKAPSARVFITTIADDIENQEHSIM